MFKFYFSMDCGNCDEEILNGINGTTIEHNGLPVISFDMAAQSRFDCEHCGAENYTGDFDVLTEGGDEEAS